MRMRLCGRLPTRVGVRRDVFNAWRQLIEPTLNSWFIWDVNSFSNSRLWFLPLDKRHSVKFVSTKLSVNILNISIPLLSFY